MDGYGLDSLWGKGLYFPLPRLKRLWGSTTLLFNAYKGLFLRVLEADHSPPCSTKFKNALSFTFTSPIRLLGMVLRYRYNFI